MSGATRKRMRGFIPHDPTPVAANIADYTEQYGPGSASYSPMLTDNATGTGREENAYQMQGPNDTSQGTYPPYGQKLAPPDPTVTGVVGRSDALSYSTGLLPSRTFRQRFTGATLVRPTMGAHPAVGPVGLSNRQGRLQANVAALIDTYLPSAQEVRQQFTEAPRNRNPLTQG